MTRNIMIYRIGGELSRRCGDIIGMKKITPTMFRLFDRFVCKVIECEIENGRFPSIYWSGRVHQWKKKAFAIDAFLEDFRTKIRARL